VAKCEKVRWTIARPEAWIANATKLRWGREFFQKEKYRDKAPGFGPGIRGENSLSAVRKEIYS